MKIRGELIGLFVAKFLGLPLMFLETALLGRVLGPSDFGLWVLLIGLATGLHSFLLNWTHGFTQRRGPEEFSRSRSLTETLSLRLPWLVLGWFLILVFLVSDPGGFIQSIFSVRPEFRGIVFLNVVSAWISFEVQSQLQAMRKSRRQSFFVLASSLCSVAVLALIILSGTSPSFSMVFISVSLMRFGFWLAVIFYVIRLANLRIQWPSLKSARSVFVYGWPLLPGIALGYLSDWAGHLILNLAHDSREVGLWGAQYQIFLGLISLNSIVVTPLLPWLIARGSSESAREYFQNVAPTIISLWSIVCLGVIAFLPPIFFALMGRDFAEVPLSLNILIASIMTQMFGNIYGVLFTIQNRLKAVLGYNAVVVACNLAISLCLVGSLGILGVAIGNLVSRILGNALYLRDQSTKFSESSPNVMVIFVVCALLGLMQVFLGSSLTSRLLFLILAAPIFVLVIRRVGTVSPELVQRFFGEAWSSVGRWVNFIFVKKLPNV